MKRSLDANGRVEIANVAPGDYVLTIWREGQKLDKRRIQIKDGTNTF